MNTTPAPWRATGLLAAFLLLGLGILYAQHASKRISADVLELLPRDEQDATIRLARQTVTGRFGRTLLLALSDDQHPDKPPTQDAAALAAEPARQRRFQRRFFRPDTRGQGPAPELVPRATAAVAAAGVVRRHARPLAQRERSHPPSPTRTRAGSRLPPTRTCRNFRTRPTRSPTRNACPPIRSCSFPGCSPSSATTTNRPRATWRAARSRRSGRTARIMRCSTPRSKVHRWRNTVSNRCSTPSTARSKWRRQRAAPT